MWSKHGPNLPEENNSMVSDACYSVLLVKTQVTSLIKSPSRNSYVLTHFRESESDLSVVKVIFGISNFNYTNPCIIIFPDSTFLILQTNKNLPQSLSMFYFAFSCDLKIEFDEGWRFSVSLFPISLFFRDKKAVPSKLPRPLQDPQPNQVIV